MNGLNWGNHRKKRWGTESTAVRSNWKSERWQLKEKDDWAQPNARAVHTHSFHWSKFIWALARTELSIIIPRNKKGWSSRQSQDFGKWSFYWIWQPFHQPAIIGFYCWFSGTVRLSRKTFTFILFSLQFLTRISMHKIWKPGKCLYFTC